MSDGADFLCPVGLEGSDGVCFLCPVGLEVSDGADFLCPVGLEVSDGADFLCPVGLEGSDGANFLCPVGLEGSDGVYFLCPVGLEGSDGANFLCPVGLEGSDGANFLCPVGLEGSDGANFLCPVGLEGSDGVCFLCPAGLSVTAPAPAAASIFSSSSERFSPSPSATNVGDFRLFSHPNLEVYDEANDDEILYSVVRTMRDYATRMGRRKGRRWVPAFLHSQRLNNAQNCCNKKEVCDAYKCRNKELMQTNKMKGTVPTFLATRSALLTHGYSIR